MMFRKAADEPIVNLPKEEREEMANLDPDEVGEILKRGAGLDYREPK